MMENDLEENKSNKFKEAKGRNTSIIRTSIESESSSLMKDNDEKDSEESFPIININKNILYIIYFELLVLFFLFCSNNYIIKEKKIHSKGEEFKDNRFIFQIGRIMGTILVLILYSKIIIYAKWFIFISTLLKSIFLLINCINILFKISFFFEGFFYSFLDIYFPIWINHFFSGKEKIALLSISRTTSIFGTLIGYIIVKISSLIQSFFPGDKVDKFKLCYIILFLLICFSDFFFILTVTENRFNYDTTNSDYYFDLTITKNEKGFYEINQKKIEEMKNILEDIRQTLKCNSYNLHFSIDFISIVLARAILKISFLGSNQLFKNYYNNLEGNEEFNEETYKYISYIPPFFILIGIVLLFFIPSTKNKFILVISFIIGFLGFCLSFVKSKVNFIILTICFRGFSNLIIPYMIKKSFDCFNNKQISEIYYVFNCIIYSLSDIYLFPKSMAFYLNVVWINFFLIIIYKSKSEMNVKKKSNIKNNSDNSLVKVKFK